MKTFLGKEYTEEGFDDMMNQMADWMEEDQRYKDHQRKRVGNFLKKLSKKEIDRWFDKFLEWETKYEDMWYDRGVLTSSNLFGAVIDYFENNSKILKIDQEDFLAQVFKWGKYTFKLYQGQGCFWRIYRKNEQIFQTT